MKARILLLIIPGLLLLGGCHRNKPKPGPPLVLPPAKPSTAPPPVIEPPKVETPAGTPTQQPPADVQNQTQLPPAPEPPKPRPTRRRGRTIQAAKPVTPPATPAQPAEEAKQSTPQLGEMLSADQQKLYNRQYEVAVAESRQALSRMEGKALSKEQADSAGRIRAFLEQAETARGTDLRNAVQLAQRAMLLARDLVSTLQ